MSGQGFQLLGFSTLIKKELLRFFKVSFQTVAAPILTALLYLLIFSHVMEGNVKVFDGVRYTSFLVPGLVMMSVLQNAFANSSSSMIQSKITGNIVFVLLPPLSHWELFGAYVLAAMARGMVVGAGVFIVTVWFTHLSFISPLWILIFALLGSAILGTLGLIAGVWAEKFDGLAGAPAIGRSHPGHTCVDMRLSAPSYPSVRRRSGSVRCSSARRSARYFRIARTA